MTGSSGATVTIEDGVAVKGGNARVAEQGWWISQHQSTVLPRVTAVGSDWYHMEVLYDLDPQMSHYRLLEHVLAGLTRIWAYPPENGLDHVAHVTKMRALCADDFEWETLTNVASAIDWANIRTCLTHGDPTLENVMRRANGDIVLIDPTPSTSAVPDIRAVDTGKILMSILGYEAIRYGHPRLRWSISAIDLRESIWMNANEWAATCYWAAVHVLRAIPYAPKWARNGLRRLVYDAIRLV